MHVGSTMLRSLAALGKTKSNVAGQDVAPSILVSLLPTAFLSRPLACNKHLTSSSIHLSLHRIAQGKKEPFHKAPIRSSSHGGALAPSPPLSSCIVSLSDC
jgi:hypothetical protein